MNFQMLRCRRVLVWLLVKTLESADLPGAALLNQGSHSSVLGVDQYALFMTDTDYYRSKRPITNILKRYMSSVKMKINLE